MADGTVDLVVTSPPYNLGIAYGRYSDRQDREGYLEWCHEWATQIRRVLKPAGSLFLNLGASPSNPLLPHELVLRLRDLFVLQNTIHWIKAITIEDEQGELISRGHFKPINSPRYLNDCHEYIFHLTPEGQTPIDRLALGVPYADKSNIARWSHTGGSDRRCRGNTWFIPYETIQRREKDRPHPATFPVELATNCIRLHGLRDDLVMLDPFLGIGNSALAAQRLRCGEIHRLRNRRRISCRGETTADRWIGRSIRPAKVPKRTRPGLPSAELPVHRSQGKTVAHCAR